MLIMGMHQTPSLTQDRYEEVVRMLTNGKRRLESPSDLRFEGLLVHAAGQGPNGFGIFDVFESEGSCRALSRSGRYDPGTGRHRRTGPVFRGAQGGLWKRLLVSCVISSFTFRVGRATMRHAPFCRTGAGSG